MGLDLRTAFSTYLTTTTSILAALFGHLIQVVCIHLRLRSTAVIFSLSTASLVLALVSVHAHKGYSIGHERDLNLVATKRRTESVDEVHNVQQLQLHALNLLSRRPVLA